MNTAKVYGNSYLPLSLGLVIIIVGFMPTYFGNLGQFSLPYHVHGISASLWMILLVVQPYLFKTKRLALHRALGKLAFILIPTIIIGGMVIMKLMIHRQDEYPPNAVYQLSFIDALTLLGFAVLFALAMVHRKNLKLHARYMVCTIFGPILPALTRVFLFNAGTGFTISLTYSYTLIEIVLLMIILQEGKVKEVKLTYVPVLIYSLFQHVTMYYSGEWIWWQNTINFLTGYQ